MSIFRAYDIRGIYGEDLTEEIMQRLGKALGTFLGGNKTVCVGYDVRNSSKALFKSFSSGLLSTGCSIVSVGLVPNPILYFYSWKNKLYGAYITASHNPKEWNGLKLVMPNGLSFIDQLQDLKIIYDSEEFIEGKGTIKEVDGLRDYTIFLKEKFGTLAKKVVVESFGGTGALILDTLREFGLEVKGLHDKPDGTFYGFEPEPKGENMEMLRQAVKREGADFGVAYDCDLDRSVFVDDNGRQLNGSMMAPVFSEYFLKKERGSILVTADCSSEIEKGVKELGGNVIWWRVGHGFIEQKGMEEKVLFSVEQSSHFYFNKFYHFSDGILATLMAAKILSESKEKLSKLVNKTKVNPMEKMYIEVGSEDEKTRIMSDVIKRFPKALNIMDGIKISLNETEWVLIRASQTTPKINICIEAKTEENLENIRREYVGMIKSL